MVHVESATMINTQAHAGHLLFLLFCCLGLYGEKHLVELNGTYSQNSKIVKVFVWTKFVCPRVHLVSYYHLQKLQVLNGT